MKREFGYPKRTVIKLESGNLVVCTRLSGWFQVPLQQLGSHFPFVRIKYRSYQALLKIVQKFMYKVCDFGILSVYYSGLSGAYLRSISIKKEANQNIAILESSIH